MFKSWRNWLTGAFTFAHRDTRRRATKTPACRRTPLHLEELQSRIVPTGTWTAFTNPAPGGVGTMLLVSDGSIMAQQGGSNVWYQLTPGANGGYASTGTWSTRASMGLDRLYFGSNVLPDGRVFVVGGEYSSAGDDTNTGEIYNPANNTWTPIANFPQANFGDDPSMVLDNGQVLCGYLFGPQTYLYNPATDTWTQAATKLNNDQSDEESWVKLPDGSILSVDVFNSVNTGQNTAQRYIPSLNQWVPTGNLPVALSSADLGYELGPGLLLPDGRAFYIGATGHTALYDPRADSWAQGPDVPNGQHADDAPGCVLPNGHVLFAADGPGGTYSPPTHLYEYDPVANTMTQVADPTDLSNVPVFSCRMLMLPNGRVAFTDGSNQLYVYTPDSGPNAAWAPTISSIDSNGDGTFTLTGTQLNGISAGAGYGDDAEMDSNYPIVEFLDAGGNYHYARSFNWSSTGVQTGSTPVTTQFTLPAGISNGAYLVQVAANGITSSPVLEVLTDSSLNNVTLQFDPNNSNFYEVLNNGVLLSEWAIGSFSDVEVNMQSSGTVTLTQTPSGVPVNVHGIDAATLNIGANGSVQGILGPVTSTNPPDYTTINVDDSADPTPRTVTVGNGATSGFGVIHGLAPADINFKYIDTAQVTISTGTGGNTVNVLATAVTTNLIGHGFDTVNISNNGSVQDIQGTLNITNPPSYTTINVDDSADPFAQNATLSQATINGDPNWEELSGLAPAAINYYDYDVSSVAMLINSSSSVDVQDNGGIYTTVNGQQR